MPCLFASQLLYSLNDSGNTLLRSCVLFKVVSRLKLDEGAAPPKGQLLKKKKGRGPFPIRQFFFQRTPRISSHRCGHWAQMLRAISLILAFVAVANGMKTMWVDLQGHSALIWHTFVCLLHLAASDSIPFAPIVPPSQHFNVAAATFVTGLIFFGLFVVYVESVSDNLNPLAQNCTLDTPLSDTWAFTWIQAIGFNEWKH